MITIREALDNELHLVQEIAHKTWPHTYAEILGEEQLNFMLDSFYSIETLLESKQLKGHIFILLFENEKCVGFTSFEHEFKKSNNTHIHKIYLLPETQGKGLGKMLLQSVQQAAEAIDASTLSLNVNRFNSALNFYNKLGFETIEEVDIAIGNGYLMQDYVMEKKLL